ncbi:MAG: DNA-methyltransferase [Desulfobacca sp.]|uniref:DNA-methyltransferase n=1 Tax=Desulfobacca sp. TaxID=2067990 RepID=UPI00404A8B69
MKKGSKTSSFGTTVRINHDASAYYGARLYAELLPADAEQVSGEQELPREYENRIICHSAEKMPELPANCLHLMVTSPPYNVSKEYDDDLSLQEYLALLRAVLVETYRVLVPGGRACINIANLGRRPYLPLTAFITNIMLEIGFRMRGEIIWHKGAAAGTSMAWGSWQSAANPVLRDVHEYILVFSKGSFSRQKPPDRENTISKEQFLEWTKSVWTMSPESAKKVGHPAPFPVELPYRLLHLYTFRGDVVLDPFMGSGTTAIAALQTGRRYVGYEINPTYAALAERRLAPFKAQKGLEF